MPLNIKKTSRLTPFFRSSCESLDGKKFPALLRPYVLLNALVMMALSLIVFGDLLLLPGHNVLSMFGADLSDYFVYTRAWGFRELRQGNLPLWNPYFFCGIPCFGLFQEALLYPFSVLFLCLPLRAAINWSIVSHVFLLGFFMYLWAGYNGRSPLAALLAGVLVMFGGATFLHIFAGHLSLVCAMPWAALVFLSLDGCWTGLGRSGAGKPASGSPLAPWIGLGAAVVCFQVLAGHPQTVFVTAIAAGLYVACKVAGDITRWRLLLFLAVIYLAGGILSAVQLAAGMAANADSIRGGGVFYKFAAMFSFPPENLLTLIIPGFFGDMHHLPYWGRCYLWETNLFFGVTGFVLLTTGLLWSIKNKCLTWPVVTGVLIILALGKNTPLFRFLYEAVPGFDLFRGSSKFILPAFLFMAMLAALGFDRIQQEALTSGGVRARLVLFCLGLGLLLSISALFLWQQEAAGTPDCLWGNFMRGIGATQEGYLPDRHYQDARIISQAAYLSKTGLMTAGFLLLVIAALFRMAGKSRFLTYIVLIMAVGELLLFARYYRPAFDINRCFSPVLAQTFSSLGPDDRILHVGRHNQGMVYNTGDLWGHGPGIRRRYAELMFYSQGYDPEEASQYLLFRKTPKAYSMLRCGAGIKDGPDGQQQVRYLPSPLPRAFLVGSYKVLSEKNEILRYVTSDAFDPRQEVVLEANPDPEPALSGAESLRVAVKIADSSTDHLDIEVNTPQSAILVVTDTFSQGWRAVSLEQPTVQDYVIMPANYALRAIPLQKGRHKIRLAYQPPLIKAGLMISVSGWVLFLVGWPVMLARKRRKMDVAVCPD